MPTNAEDDDPLDRSVRLGYLVKPGDDEYRRERGQPVDDVPSGRDADADGS